MIKKNQLAGRMKYKLIIVLLITTVFFSIRLYNIDADPPALGLTTYQPITEGQYGKIALYKTTYGTILPEGCNVGEHYRNDIFLQMMTYIGMKLYGDNYLGFRFGSFIFGMLVCITFVMILFRILKKSNKSNSFVLYVFIAIMLFDFVFTTASRIVENSIYRMFFVNLCFFLSTYIDFDSSPKDYFFMTLLGFFSVLSVLGVYITNIFLPVSLLIWILSNKEKKCGKSNYVCHYTFGAIISYFVCEIYYYRLWGTSCLKNTLDIFTAYSGVDRKSINSDLNFFEKILLSGYHFISANCNLYNIVLFLLFGVFLFSGIKLANEKKDYYIKLGIFTFITFFIQSALYDDYIIRKYIIVYFIVYYFVFYVFINFDLVITIFKKNKLKNLIGLIMFLLLALSIVLYRLFYSETKGNLDFSIIDKILVMSQVIAVVILTIWLIRLLFFEKNRLSYNFVVIVTLISSLLVNGYFSGRYNYFQKYHKEKEIMKELSEIVGDDYVYGRYTVGYLLYNDIRPISNSYDDMIERINQEEEVWYLDYSNYAFSKVMINNTSLNWEEKYTFNREFLTNGVKNNISLYKLKKE